MYDRVQRFTGAVPFCFMEDGGIWNSIGNKAYEIRREILILQYGVCYTEKIMQ